jgi:UDP-N-acetylglucosamine transferase subunit ALG13
MIFVTVGTNEAPFDRLLHLVDSLGMPDDLIVQHGSSSVRPAARELVDFVPFDTLIEHVRAARAVVTHAGVGSVIVSLSQGKRPIVVARRQRHGEAVDDHQVDFARRFASAGLVTLVESSDELRRALELTADAPQAFGGSSRLAAELRSVLGTEIARRR